LPSTKKMKWDDINLEDEYWFQGDPILFTNPQIRRMLSLADLGKNDVFYDLGCGFGQNLIIALAEFDVGEAVGIELDRERAWRAKRRLKELGLDKKGSILEGDYQELLTEARLKKATAIFYGLETDTSTLSRIGRVWDKHSPGRKLIYYERHLIPEFIPTTSDPPFFMSLSIFEKPKSRKEWLTKVVLQPKNLVGRARKPTERELWDELAHNLDVLGVRTNVEDYKERLNQTISRR
jgi:precorrin-6B methylase 2